MKTIDDFTAKSKMQLRNTFARLTGILDSIEIWPCYNVISDLEVTDNSQNVCVSCNKQNIVSIMTLCGQPYNHATLQPSDEIEKPIEPTQLDGPFKKVMMITYTHEICHCILYAYHIP